MSSRNVQNRNQVMKQPTQPVAEVAVLPEAPVEIVAESTPQVEAVAITATDDVKELPNVARLPQVFATACPTNPNHKNTRVYGKRGTVRYCVCNDCGETWKQSGPEPVAK